MAVFKMNPMGKIPTNKHRKGGSSWRFFFWIIADECKPILVSEVHFLPTRGSYVEVF